MDTWKKRIVGEVTECYCTKCKRTLPVSMFTTFHHKKHKALLYVWHCKDCVSLENQLHRSIKYGTRTVGKCKEVKCLICGKVQPVSEFMSFKRWGGEVYTIKCNTCKKNNVKKPKLTNANYCRCCIHYSTLRRKCKKGLSHTPQPCSIKETYSHTNMSLNSNIIQNPITNY